MPNVPLIHLDSAWSLPDDGTENEGTVCQESATTETCTHNVLKATCAQCLTRSLADSVTLGVSIREKVSTPGFGPNQLWATMVGKNAEHIATLRARIAQLGGGDYDENAEPENLNLAEQG